jgi:hypothetical protein
VADDRNLRAAFAYARIGWRVFPCIPREKVPATAHGVKDATSDPAQITKWWQRNPDRNVAIACGYPGPDVLDIDHKPDGTSGFPALRELRQAGLITNPRAMIRTPNDGAHLYFAPTPGSGNGSIASRGIDHRGEGGYVVAPPSEVRRAADGQLRPYVVVHHQASTDRIRWAAIREHLEPQRERQWEPPRHLREGGQQNLDHLVDHMAGLGDGRKRYLFWAANRILDHGQPERLADLERAARAAGSDPRQIARTIESARQQARQDPHRREPAHVSGVRVGGRRELPPAPARERDSLQTRAVEQEPERRGRVAVLEADRDELDGEVTAPEPGRKPQPQPAPSAERERHEEPEPGSRAERTEHSGAEPASREPEREHEDQADAEHEVASEPGREEPARPFAQAEPGREAGE